MVHFRNSLLTVRLFVAVACISAIEWLADVALHRWAPGSLGAAEGLTRLLHGGVLFIVVWFLSRKVSGLIEDVRAQHALQSRLADLSRVALEDRALGDVKPAALAILAECVNATFAILAEQTDNIYHAVQAHGIEGMALMDMHFTLLNTVDTAGRVVHVRDAAEQMTLPPVLRQSATHLLLLPCKTERPSILVAGFKEAPRPVALQIAARIGSFIEHAHRVRIWREEQRLTDTMFRQMAENIEEVFYIADAAMERLYYISPAYEKVWGKTCASLYDNIMSWMDPIHEDDRELAVEAVGTLVETGRYDRTYRIVTDAGHTRWIRDRAFPVYDHFGRVERIAGIAADITAIKDADEQHLKFLVAAEHRAREDAELELRTRNDVLAMVSHDLRAPLTTVSMVVEKILRSAGSDERMIRSLERARKSADYMNRLVEELLDVTRVSSGKLVLDQTRLTVAALLQEVHDVYEEPCTRKNIEFRIDLGDANLPSLSLDRTRMLQVFGNLVSNSIKFTPEGGRITVAAEPGDDQVVFVIADTGRGIPAGEIAHLFEPFWQKAGGEKRGLGLGLPIVKAVVEAHGGRIWVESQEGVGTTIRFSVPTGPGAEVRDVEAAQRVTEDSSPSATH